MRFSVLSGAIKNAGDYLIVDRSIKLLDYVFPNCEINVFERKLNLQDNLQEINTSDALIFAGGPVLKEEIYPEEMPLVSNLNDIKVPMYTIGLGWYGKNNLEDTIYERYKFSPATKQMANRMNEDGTISCRDWYTIRILKNQGFSNTVMTGCPAWYDVSAQRNQGVSTLEDKINMPYKKICISDPSYAINMQRSYEVAQYIRNKYPKAELHFIFHRGIEADENTSQERAQKNVELAKKIEGLGVITHNIAYSCEGFKIYDDCDIHIGFRVHAHIYNLSKRNISVLIEEDGRGIGTDEAMGLYGVKPYIYRWNNVTRRVDLISNEYYLKNLDDYLFMLERNEFSMIKQAYMIQESCFATMIKHIRTFKNDSD